MKLLVPLAVLIVAAAAAALGATLPQKIVISRTVVNRYFPEVTRVAFTGANSTAVGKTTATRSVIYANGSASKKVTITVDRYASSGDAISAYAQALKKSNIPGFKPLSVPSIGERSFGGTVSRGQETHVGIGSLDGKLIVGATIAGYAATRSNITKLVSILRAEHAIAKAL